MREAYTVLHPRGARRPRWVTVAGFGCILAAFSVFCAASLSAQDNGNLAERVQSLEQQVAELQRRVGRDSAPEEPGTASGPDAPLPARVAALERQVQQLFAQLSSTPQPASQNGPSLPTVRPAVLLSVSAPALASTEPAAATQSLQTSLPALRRPARHTF